MKTKHYIKLLAPLCIFGFLFRILEIVFAIEPDTGYFVSGSVIPLIFNIYIILAVLFFMSVIFTTKKEQKTVKKRFVKFTFVDNIFTMLSAVFILAGSLQTFVTKYFIDGTLTDVTVLFKDVTFYSILSAVLSVFFLVQFATSPKSVSKHGFYAILSLFVPIHYVLRLFVEFTDMSKLLSHSYGTYTIIYLCFITLSFINLSKVLAGSLCRKYLMAYSLCAVFMGAIHLAECVMSFIPGNPYNISINLLTYLADLFICLMLISIFLKVSKKPKVSEKPNDDTAELPQEETAETEVVDEVKADEAEKAEETVEEPESTEKTEKN